PLRRDRRQDRGGELRLDRALTARHVEVARSIVNNNPETMDRSRRSIPTAAGWFFSVSRAQRSTQWCAADTDLGLTRDRRPHARKSGKPDLRGPFQSVAVPDQRCTAPPRYALHRVRDTR